MANIEVLSIGDELLSGETVDTNSSYLDGLLESLGHKVLRHQTIPDELDAIAEAFRNAAARADVVISTGGLGPTQDDLTMEGLAMAMGCELRKDEATLEGIKQKFAAFGREMSPNNARQAMVPEIGEVLDNPVGTAPAFCGAVKDAQVFLLPGVPREVRFLFKERVAPRLPKGEQAALRRTIKVMGVGESRLEHSIREVVKAHPSVRFGFRTKGVENHIKLYAQGAERQTHVEAAEAALVEILQEHTWGRDEDDFMGVLAELLIAHKRTVATCESCTGGLVAKLLTERAGSSAYMLGGCVTYANEAKVQLVGVRQEDLDAHGAVSEPVARQMAEGVRKRLGADFGLSTTGVAGPGGGSEEKPVGTVWIAVAGPEKTEAMKLRLPGSRAFVREGSAHLVLNQLRLLLIPPKKPIPDTKS